MRCFGFQLPDLERVPTPIGEPCTWCGEPIAAHDTGVLIRHVSASGTQEKPRHEECNARIVLGSVGHQKGLCSCYGGSQEDDPSLSMRENAHAALAYYSQHLRQRVKQAIEAGRVSMADSEGIEQFQGIATSFMREIFALEPDQYQITDESSLGEFASYTPERAQEMAHIKARIAAVYGLQDCPNNLLAIFRLLGLRARLQ